MYKSSVKETCDIRISYIHSTHWEEFRMEGQANLMPQGLWFLTVFNPFYCNFKLLLQEVWEKLSKNLVYLLRKVNSTIKCTFNCEFIIVNILHSNLICTRKAKEISNKRTNIKIQSLPYHRHHYLIVIYELLKPI